MKHLNFIAIFLLMTLAINACTKPGASISVKSRKGAAEATLSSVSIEPESATVAKGQSQQFKAYALYSDGQKVDVTDQSKWTSVAGKSTSDSEKPGRFVSNSSGTDSVQAEFETLTGKASLTVSSADLQKLLLLSSSSSSLSGTNQQYYALGAYSDSSTADVTADVQWSSSNSAIASISNNTSDKGVVSILSTGTAALTATLGSVSSNEVSVVGVGTLTGVHVSPANITVPVGYKQQLNLIAEYGNGQMIDVTKLATWSSSSVGNVTVDNTTLKGQITGVAAGAAVITASFGGQSTTYNTSATAVTLESLAFSPTSLSLKSGSTQKASVIGTFSDGSEIDLTGSVTLTSSSSGSSSVTFNDDLRRAEVKGVAAGSATISASLSGKSASLTTAVSSATLTSITAAEVATAINTRTQLVITANYSDATTLDVSSQASFGSTSPETAVVLIDAEKAYVVAGSAAGSATLTASFGGFSVSIPAKVTAASITSLTISPSSTTSMGVGESNTFSATAVYSDGTTQDVSSAVAWSVDQPTRASVSNSNKDKGLLTGVGTGAVSLTATLGSTTASKSITITSPVGIRVVVTPKSASVATAATQQFTATKFFSNHSTSDVTSTATWSSSATSKATVSSSGLATGASAGTSTISATSSGLTGSAALTVLPALSSIAVTPAAPSITVGQTQQFVATGTYSDASTQNLTSSVTWSRTNGTGTATISAGGLLSTTAAGTVTVTATSGSVSGSTTATLADPVGVITAGSFSSSTSISSSGFTLNWSAGSDTVTTTANLQYFVCSGASAAAIDTVSECLAATQAMAYTANTLTLTVTGKAASTTYYYNVVVKNAGAATAIYNGTSVTTSSDSVAPTAGTIGTSTSVTPTSFTLTWTAASDNLTSTALLQYFVCSGASAAAIDTASECLAATQEMAYTANTLSLAVSGKTPSTTYYYNVVVKDSAGNTSIYNGKSQATTADTTAPTVGAFSASTSVTETGFILNWSASSDAVTSASNIQYFVCSGASVAAIDTAGECLAATTVMAYTANTLTVTITGRAANTTYYYNVVARDAAGNTAVYTAKTQATLADTTAPTAGTFSSATSVTATGFVLNWTAGSDNVTAASSLQYFVCSGASAAAINTASNCTAATTAMSYTTNTLTLTVTGRTPSTTYYYNVVVRDGASNATVYPGTSVTTTADTTAPTVGAFSASSSVTVSGFVLNWTASSDDITATASLQYFLCLGPDATTISTVSGCLGATQIKAYTANSLNHTITGLSASTTYYYNVVVRDAAGNTSIYPGKSQATLADTTAPTAGAFSAATSVGFNGFTLNWTAGSDAVTSAANLQYYVCSGASTAALNSVANCLAATQEMNFTTNTLTLAITGKSASTTYYYNVIVQDAAGNRTLYTATSQATTANNGSWTAMSTTSAPTGKEYPNSAWTGSKLIVWGGSNGSGIQYNGKLYDPVANSWSSITTTGAPTEGMGSNTVSLWIGDRLMVWGGFDNTSSTYKNVGYLYNPESDSWSTMSTTSGPPIRILPSVVWTGSKVLMWAGQNSGFYYNTGFIYDPSTDSWSSMSSTSAPTARNGAGSVWTGSKMVVWGGVDSGGTYLNTGGSYDPETNSWSSIATPGAGVIRATVYPTLVWSGKSVLVWGGSGSTGLHNEGGIYTPGTNTWSAITTTSAPAARAAHATIWTGSYLLVWGGSTGSVSNTGGLYNPETNAWLTSTSTSSAPTGRLYFAYAWTGSKMLIWGGRNASTTYYTDGSIYSLPNYSVNTWSAITTTSAPSARESHSAVWTGSKMIVWGGNDGTYANTGGAYDPVANSWSAVTTTSAPSARSHHTAIWNGSKMIVWGGKDGSGDMNTGGLYDPAADSWSTVSTTSAPAARSEHSAVWTGKFMIVWGGAGPLNSGGLYNPSANTWSAVTTTGAPDARHLHSAVWANSKMIIWGGEGSSGALDSGALYNPTANSWTAMSTTSAPSARYSHTAVWSGRTMIVWGGDSGSGGLATGSRYDPATNSWATVTATSAPAARTSHSAVWTGGEMIVWGGSNLNSGSKYDPIADTWTAISTTSAPAARSGHVSVWTGAAMLVWGGTDGAALATGGVYKP